MLAILRCLDKIAAELHIEDAGEQSECSSSPVSDDADDLYIQSDTSDDSSEHHTDCTDSSEESEWDENADLSPSVLHTEETQESDSCSNDEGK
jgi:hypothetical protein